MIAVSLELAIACQYFICEIVASRYLSVYNVHSRVMLSLGYSRVSSTSRSTSPAMRINVFRYVQCIVEDVVEHFTDEGFEREKSIAYKHIAMQKLE